MKNLFSLFSKLLPTRTKLFSVIATILVFSLIVFGQSQSGREFRTEMLTTKILSSTPTSRIPSNHLQIFSTSDGYQYRNSDGDVVTLLDSVNSEDIVLNAHTAVSVTSTTFTLDASNKGIITLTGTASGKKITTISNGADGQVIELHFGDSNVTVDSGAAKLLGNVDFVGANYSALRLAYNGTEWREAGRSQVVGLLGIPASFTTLAASGATTLTSTLAVTGNVAVNTDKFTVAASSGNTVVAGTLGVTGLSTFGSFKGTANLGGAVVALTPGTTVALDSTLGNTFTDTPAQNQTINVATVPATDQTITLRVLTSGTSSYTLTFGTNFKSTGTLATGTSDAKVFVITFRSDGTNFNEVSRTTAM